MRASSAAEPAPEQPDSLDASEFTVQVSAIAALKEPVRRALYAYVLSRPEAVGREEAAQAVGIARELAAFHLDKLLEQGLLDVEYRRRSGRSGPGAGRPAKLYRPSDRQVEISLPDRRYELAARLLAEAFAHPGADPAQALEGVARRFGEGLGAQARQRLGPEPSSTRILQTTCEVLRAHGFNPTETDGAVRLRNCPFQALAQDHPELVCGMNLSMAQGLLAGLGAASLQARLDPQPGMCCVILAAGQRPAAASPPTIAP
jgi:predicted ArsR family transcriptional regulator